MESGNVYNAPALHPLGLLPNHTHHQESLSFLQQFPLMNTVVPSKPFDPYFSMTGLGFPGLDDPYEGIAVHATPLQGFHGSEFLNFSNAKDVWMDVGMGLGETDLKPDAKFVIPDESSCVTNAKNNGGGGRNGVKRSKSVNKNNLSIRARSSLARMTNRGSKKSKSMKGQWTIEEDKLLIRLVEIYGVRKWSHIAQMMKGRIGKQCRERWHNHLRPDIKKDQWTEEEDRILIEAHSQIGNKWAEIAKRLAGRTENSIKNHWNATKRRQFSRRKCRTKWPKPSYILQNYIKSLYSEKEGEKKLKNGETPPPETGDLETLNDALANVTEFGLTCENEYDNLDDVLNFTFDDFQVFDGAGSSIDSSLGDAPRGLLPSTVDENDEKSYFLLEFPFDVASIVDPM
ncbi:transcription repressor MYB5-like [Andrographis paniculata]|uniref:transcription repressor MYB5-like n=1 Tax=Andrographis paniculata TaxID=175694 RepID=UPI0021E82557|nr:transcription repressor MYB5-like [Andrographis paniculata]